MKVTVCFGAIKVIVPCGEGTLSVGELIDKSVQRYKKATGRSPDYWVHVHSLASQSEGGILDVDDVVSDVADDREKLTAHFEEQDPNRAHVVSNHLLGDGTSTCASSVGTASPINFSDMNHVNNSNNKTHHMHHSHHSPHMNGTLEEDNEMDVVVTGEESNSKLLVRRGSDPVITSMLTKSDVNGENTVMDKNANTLPAKTSSSDKPRSRRGSRDELLNSAFSRFGRDSAGSARQSLSSAHPSMNKWTDAQQKAESQGGSERGPDVMIEGDQDAETDSIVLTNDGTPLGVHIISKIEQEDGSAFGIVVHSIEAGGRAARDGRLRPGDYIVQINGSDISLHSFNRAQEMLRDAMRNPTVKLTLQRDTFFSSEAAVGGTTPRENGHLHITIPPKSPDGKVPPVIPVRSPTTALSSPTDPKSPNAKLIAPMSTRRIGRKLYIQLMKGPQGLGFSVTSRDNPTGGKNPIFIKNILPKGAAICDGRLKPGDRVMEVNGIEMTGKSQSEAVSILRSVKLGGVVNLVVSRQDSPVKMVPRQLPEDTAPVEDPVTSPQNRAVMTFDIPLNDTGSAGLGVSVKGKTSGATEDHSSKDLGIFIKSVIHGGAASKDCRLRPNDQLLCINDTSLANMSNSEAMETLRLAMSHEKSPRSTISLVIARRLDQQEPTFHTNNLNKGATSPATDRNVDSGLLSPLPQKDGNFGMPNSLSDGVLSSRTMNGGGMHRGNEIVVQASVEPHHATSPRHQGAKVTYPGSDGEPIYSRGARKSSSGQTLPSSSGSAETAMQADASPPPMHLSIHSSPSARAPSPPQWLLDWENGAKDGELSPLPDPDNFARDNYARASFSERRQGGSLDAKQMAWYKKTKGETPNKPTTSAQKDVAASTSSLLRSSSMDSLLDSKPSTSRVEESSSKTMGPGLGMEKSSSLESLQVAVANVHQQREDFPGRPRAKVRRGRVCNDSFRAAVDRSYGDQSPNGDMPPMYTVMEAEENGGYGISRSSGGGGGGGDGSIQSAGSMKKKKDKKEDKSKAKSSGTGFKGLFRFGKNRKSIGSENALKGKDKDSNKSQISATERLEQEEVERRKARQQAKQEHEKIQEEIQKLREAKIKEENQEALSKADKMMQLRQQYQQRHLDNQGQYIDDGEEDEDDYTRVDPNSHQETMSQTQRLEAARAEQRERERQNSRVPERDRYERLPQEAEDRRKERRDDIYSEPKDRRDDRTSNNRYSDDPYADPRTLRNGQDQGRNYDDRYGRRNDRDVEENPYVRYNGKKDHGAQEPRDGRHDRNRDNRSSDPPKQERRRSLKRTDRIENARNRADARAQGKENVDLDKQEKREGDEKERERRPNERRAEYASRSDRSTERKNPKRDEQRQDARRDDRYKDSRYDGRKDERHPEREGERDDRFDARRDDRYYDQDGGRRQEDSRRDRQPPREERHDKYPDQRDRYRTAPQEDRHGYGSLDKPSRRPRGKDPNYYSMSENSRPEDDYARTQNYSRHNNYTGEHQQQAPRRTSYPNGPVPNHTSYPSSSGPGGDRARRANSTSDYLEYKDMPPRSKSVSDQLMDEYQYDSRRAPAGPRKGNQQRPNDMGEGRMYNDYDDAARV
ncbi:partitioning defective 3 homolog isoform X2 [Strongylocentrotus purpuratus]|uniref:PDZ domain-containing protein n=1 Tax=Strongylocentrotus purpuratus TaxID=7668 RepID=A0A7M7N392_STRPU|nr:partitioning defective 3 homolog isoform X2 [Strongylocentrotus purpuratus]